MSQPSSLRDQLARIMYETLKESQTISGGVLCWTDWGLVADEVIRQMEWARSPFKPAPPCESGDWSEPARWFPLTVAPDEFSL